MSRRRSFIRQFKRNYDQTKKSENRKLRKEKKQISMEAKNNFSLILKRSLNAKSENQIEYIRSIAENDVTFCIGPSGSGKTHIATGLALEYLAEGKCERIIISRPAVEAGESLGFLPGKLEEKMSPYLVPLIDEMNYYVSYSDITFMMAPNNKIIEVVPLAMMRGRTFRDAVIILDEAQNATLTQLKLFLTRIGFGSKIIINGDLDQSDLPYGTAGLDYCVNRLNGVKNIGVVTLDAKDIVRHPIIGEILKNLG